MVETRLGWESWLSGPSATVTFVRDAPVPDPPRHSEDLSDAVTIADAARLLGVSTRTVYRIIERKSLVPFYLPGSGRPRIPLDQIVAIRKQTNPDSPLGKPVPRPPKSRED
ncbi:MAG: helix-turn-helix domain-containing protein [Planctomycetales bacterium]|nr:helix-turn-helix domain-containing protein [Planctomycetales bacterium]